MLRCTSARCASCFRFRTVLIRRRNPETIDAGSNALVLPRVSWLKVVVNKINELPHALLVSMVPQRALLSGLGDCAASLVMVQIILRQVDTFVRGAISDDFFTWVRSEEHTSELQSR